MNHKDLDVWKISIEFVDEIYRATKFFPIEERHCLSNQMRKAAVSIPSNIAEGSARRNPKELRQFLYVAMGSLAEIETQLLIAIRLGYLQETEGLMRKIIRIRAMISRLLARLALKV